MKNLNFDEVRRIAELEKPDLVPVLDELNKKCEDSSNYYIFAGAPKTDDESQIYCLMEDNEFSPMEVRLYMAWSFMNMIHDRPHALRHHPMKEGAGSHIYIALNTAKLIEAACNTGVLKSVSLNEKQHREHLIDALDNLVEL